MKRVELYVQLLKAINVIVGDNDQLFLNINDVKTPVVYDDKPFYLPTKNNLAKPAKETENYLFFDPLTESMMRQESESVKILRFLMINRLQYCIYHILTNLINILKTESVAKNAEGNQTLLYRLNIQPSSTANRSLTKLLREGVKDTVTNRIVSIFLKRGGVLNDERYARLAVVDFPILDNMNDKVNTIFGVDMPSRDRNTILELLCYIIYGCKEKLDNDDFSAGSNIKFAPYFQSLCFAFCNVAHRLNDVNKTYKSLYIANNKRGDNNSNIDDLIHIDLEFEPNIQELNIFKKDPMPLLPGNTGIIKPSSVKDDKDKDNKKVKDDVDIDDTTINDVTPVAEPQTQQPPQVHVQEQQPRIMTRKMFNNGEQSVNNRATCKPVISNYNTIQPPKRVVKRVVVVEQPPVEDEIVYVDVNGNVIDPKLIKQNRYQPYNPNNSQYSQQYNNSGYVSRRLANVNTQQYVNREPRRVNRYTGQEYDTDPQYDRRYDYYDPYWK